MEEPWATHEKMPLDLIDTEKGWLGLPPSYQLRMWAMSEALRRGSGDWDDLAKFADWLCEYVTGAE